MPSVVGMGYLFTNLTNLNKKKFSYGYFGIIGCFFLILYSYVSHFFISHNLIHNSVLFFIGIISFLFLLRIEYRKKEIIILTVTFFILYICLLSYKTNDDFPYYHFAYTYYLNQNPIILGIGKLNHGFSTPSSIFYLNSLFYLPFIKYFSFQMAAILFMGFTITVLITEISNYFKTKKLDFVFYFSLLSLAFVCTFFYRISEHGTDRSAQILIILLVIEMLIIFNLKKINLKNITNLIILIILSASLKPIYFIYFLFFFLFIYYSRKKLTLILEVIKSKIFLLSTVFILFVISVNFLNSGCLIYPLTFVCFDHFTWSIPIDQVNHMNQHYNLWSKAGITPNFRIVNPEEYLKDFKWVSNWFDLYFFNKVSDYLLGLLVLLLFVFLILFKSNKNKFTSIKFLPVYLLIVILFLEWFFHHPALRYGGYHLIALLFFIPFSIYLSHKTFNHNKMSKKIFLVIILIFSIFVVRNIQRISKEYQVYNYNLFIQPSFDKKFENYSIYSEIIDAKGCNINNCNKEGIASKEFMNKYIFIINQ